MDSSTAFSGQQRGCKKRIIVGILLGSSTILRGQMEGGVGEGQLSEQWPLRFWLRVTREPQHLKQGRRIKPIYMCVFSPGQLTTSWTAQPFRGGQQAKQKTLDGNNNNENDMDRARLGAHLVVLLHL